MRILFLTILLVFGMTVYGQFTKGNFYLGGQIRFEASTTYNEILEISPHFGYFILNKLSIGVSSSYSNLFISGEDPIFSIDPNLRYYLVNKKFGLFLLTGGKFNIGDNPYKNSPPILFKPKLGLGFCFGITDNVLIDSSIDLYMYKGNSAFNLDQKFSSGILIKF